MAPGTFGAGIKNEFGKFPLIRAISAADVALISETLHNI
jgi:hypothetical protein